MEAVARSSEFPPDVDTLWDLRELDFTEIDSNFERELIQVRDEFPERRRARLALVVEGDLGFGMSRMYEILSESLPQQSKVFRSYSEGEEWLLRGLA